MTLVFLYSELMGYNLPLLNALSEVHDVVVIEDDNIKLHSQKNNDYHHFRRVALSTIGKNKLVEYIANLSPNLLVISGWYNKYYLECAKKLKSKSLKAVLCFDTQWEWTGRKILGAAYLRSKRINRIFDFVWVPGRRQAQFAKLIGFSECCIKEKLYCADTDLFSSLAPERTRNIDNKDSQCNYLFVGRFDKVKSFDSLMEAWSRHIELYPTSRLHLIGDGSLKMCIPVDSNVIVHGYKSAYEIANIAVDCDAFILPSIYEPWGVVIHEMVSIGLPLIISRQVGAGDTFFQENLNGISLVSCCSYNIAQALEIFESTTAKERKIWSINSLKLSKTISMSSQLEVIDAFLN